MSESDTTNPLQHLHCMVVYIIDNKIFEIPRFSKFKMELKKQSVSISNELDKTNQENWMKALYPILFNDEITV